jgi:hypothetical protein
MIAIARSPAVLDVIALSTAEEGSLGSEVVSRCLAHEPAHYEAEVPVAGRSTSTDAATCDAVAPSDLVEHSSSCQNSCQWPALRAGLGASAQPAGSR